MLIGMKCKVCNFTDHSHPDFKSYEAIIASPPQMSGDDFMVVVLTEGKLVQVDTYYLYDIELVTTNEL